MTFFDSYSYKKKNIGLVIISVLLIAVSFKKAFYVSYQTKMFRDELVLKLEKAKSANSEIKNNQIMIAKLNRFIGEQNNSVEKVQQEFLNFFAKNTRNIMVYQINEVLNYKHPDFEINTHRVILKGNFKSILNFVYLLEKDFNFAKILKVRFQYIRKDLNDEKGLYTTILIQNYKK